MAITSEITDRVPVDQKPSSTYVSNSYTPLTGTKATEVFYRTIESSTVSDPTPDTAFGNILTNIKTYVDGTFLPTTMKVDVLQTVTAVIFVDNIEVDGGDTYTTSAKNFICKVTVEWQ